MLHHRCHRRTIRPLTGHSQPFVLWLLSFRSSQSRNKSLAELRMCWQNLTGRTFSWYDKFLHQLFGIWTILRKVICPQAPALNEQQQYLVPDRAKRQALGQGLSRPTPVAVQGARARAGWKTALTTQPYALWLDNFNLLKYGTHVRERNRSMNNTAGTYLPVQPYDKFRGHPPLEELV